MALSMVSNVRRWRRLGATTVGDDSMIWSVIVITSPPSTAQGGRGPGPNVLPVPAIRHDRWNTPATPAGHGLLLPHRRQDRAPRDLRPLGWLRQNERMLNVMACVVKTVHGRVQGTVVEGGYAFLGIPYAAPPFGANRLRPPQPVTGWEGVRDASRMGPEPPQVAPPTTGGPRAGATEDWEDVAEAVRGGRRARRAPSDCLNLNVWTPDPGAAGLPVMVWIQGGMFELSSTAAYDGGRFARDGVVCVVINWRPGAEGFLYLGGRHRQPRAARPGRRARVGAGQHRRLRRRPGQRHRLRRVSRRDEHRHAPRHARAEGLFRRAILQSGAAHQVTPPEDALRIAGYLAAKLGVARDA